MCGITGITDKQIEKLESAIQKMTRCIAHRGPDDDGYFVDERVALGMRRLAIIDLEHGRQPIASDDDRYVIVFNGEIYNYRELRVELEASGVSFKTESDTEVALKLFESEGVESFKRLRGMFAIAIYDTDDKKLYLARDHFGIKPLYYWKRGNKIAAFASEIKSILALKGFKAEVNDSAVYNYLSYQYNPLPETFFKGVYKLLPGHHLTIDLETGVFDIRKYFETVFQPDKKLDEEETKKRIVETLEDSVSHHLIADVPVGSFLSGGIDSSIIATLIQKLRGGEKKSLKTFTVGFESLSEGLEAKETSDPLGTDHTEINVSAEEYFEALPKVVYHFDEPVADPSALGLYFLAREARKSVKVVLSGEGSDEFFGGYNIYLEPYARRLISWLPRFILKLITKLPIRGRNYAERALLKLEDWYIGNARIFKDSEIKKLWRGGEVESNDLSSIYEKMRHFEDSVKMQKIDIETWLVGDILAKADKMTMAHSLELRVPFLDTKVWQLSSQLPSNLKWRAETTKYILREAFKSLLPESTRNRKKLGFPTPIRNWFTAERQDLYDLILDNSYIKSHFDIEMIEKLVREHVSKQADHSRKIYLFLLLAIWYNTFIKA